MAAGSKRVRLYIDSDSSGVQKGISGAQRQLKGFEKSAKHTEGVMTGLGNTASTLGLSFGAAGLAIGLHDAIDAFRENETQVARTVASLKSLGINTAAVKKHIDDVLASQRALSGFQGNELQQSFGTILGTTKDVNESLKLNALAMDLSRGRQIPLATAAKVIGKVWDGNTAILKRYGVAIEKGDTVTVALGKAQKQYAGQAREFGNSAVGATDKANASFEVLQERIGAQVVPAMNAASQATIEFSDATGTLIDHAGGLGPILTGAAGFGAFNLLAPRIGKAGSALGDLGKVAGSKGAGASMRILGESIAESVNPLTAAGIGAGILAAGIYEIWHNSESADQAVHGLNDTILGLRAAQDQVTKSKDVVNSTRDYAKVTGDAALAAHHHTQALRIEVAELQRHAQVGTASATEVSAARKKLTKAETDETTAVHANQRAHHDLTSALLNTKLATDGVAEADVKVAQKARDVIEKANLAGVAITNASKGAGAFSRTAPSAAQAAGRFAGMMDKAAGAAKSADHTTRNADTALANFARRLGRVPTVKEINIALRAAAAGRGIDEIERRLNALSTKTVTLHFNQTFAPSRNPINPTRVTKPATGAFVAGDYSQGDRVPALLSGGEAVLNPEQIGMVDSGMSVMDALVATGAPTIGQGFAKGKQPAHYVRSNLTGLKRTTATPAQRLEKALSGKADAWAEQAARAQLKIAQADAAGDAAGNVQAYQFEARIETDQIRLINAILKNPEKALGVQGAKLTRGQRTNLLQALASAISTRSGDLKTIFDLQHPAADTSGTDTSGAGGVDAFGNPIDTGPTPDQQAILDQKQTIINNLTRQGALSEATLRGFGSSGDIGTGNFGSAFDAARGGPTLVLADARSLAAVAGAAAQGFGNQPSISANSGSVNV